MRNRINVELVNANLNIRTGLKRDNILKHVWLWPGLPFCNFEKKHEKKQHLSTTKTQKFKKHMKQIHEVKRWLKYIFAYSSSSKCLSTALTLTFRSLFSVAQDIYLTNNAHDILHYWDLSFFRFRCAVAVLLQASWQCLLSFFLKSWF